MMGHKQELKTGAEHDVVSRYWRSMYCYTQRAGVCKNIKRQMSRRDRRKSHIALRDGNYDD